MTKRIWLSSPHMSEEGYEKKYINQAFDSNWIAPLGPNVDEFERELGIIIGNKNVVALSSGTAAIHLALIAAGVRENDVVLCQSFTFAASANPIKYLGAKPVFVGSDKETWNLSPTHLRKALKKYPDSKAVIVVHLYGLTAKMDEIVSVCKEFGVILIEDAAESLGSMYKGKQTGTFGDYGIYSFNGNKIITTSGGGAIVCQNNYDVKEIKFLATQARDDKPFYEHSQVGYNYRLSNILAGVGRGQLKVLDKRVIKKRMIYDYYKKKLSDIIQIKFMPENDWCLSNYWLSVIVLDKKELSHEIIKELDNNDIEARHVWKPMHIQPLYSNCDYIGENIEVDIFSNGVCLPSDTKMTTEDLDKVISIVRRSVMS